MMHVSGDVLLFDFHDHKDKIKPRKIVFQGLEFTTSPHFPDQEDWFIHGFCLDKLKHRKFKLSRMLNVVNDKSVNP